MSRPSENEDDKDEELLVSVVLPVYEGRAFLREAVESIFAQTYTRWELVVVDDGSTDGSGKLAEELAREYEEGANASGGVVRVLRHEENRGLVEALNTGVANASGSLIARMDADDVSLPTRLERQVAYLVAHPEVSIVGSAVEMFSDQDQDPGATKTVRQPCSPGMVAWSLFFFCSLAHPTVLSRRSVFFEPHYRRYTSQFAHCEDYHLWMSLLPDIRMANLPDVLLRLRKHKGNISARFAREQRGSSCRVVHEIGLQHVLEVADGEFERTIVAALNKPSELTDVASLYKLFELIGLIESKLLKKLDWLSSSEGEECREEVHHDALSRQGEVVALAMQVDVMAAMPIMASWARRAPPDMQALLFQ